MIHTDGTPTIANCGPIPGLDVASTASQRIRAARQAIEARIELREELTPTEAAADAYYGKTSGLREALELVGQ